MTLKFVPDDRYATAPRLPVDRPPTRQECWDHYRHYYEDLKTDQEIVTIARDQWAWWYVTWVNQRQWRRPPDWTPETGPPVELDGALLFEAGRTSYYDPVKKLLEQSRERKAA